MAQNVLNQASSRKATAQGGTVCFLAGDHSDVSQVSPPSPLLSSCAPPPELPAEFDGA